MTTEEKLGAVGMLLVVLALCYYLPRYIDSLYGF
jgi:hypothetical protein